MFPNTQVKANDQLCVPRICANGSSPLLDCKLESRAPCLTYLLFLPYSFPPATGTCLYTVGTLWMFVIGYHERDGCAFCKKNCVLVQSVDGALFDPQAISLMLLVVLPPLDGALRNL